MNTSNTSNTSNNNNNVFFRPILLAIFVFTNLATNLATNIFAVNISAANIEAQNYAQPRPRSLTRDELVIAFSGRDPELDFRKSYFANEAQLFTAIYEGLFSYHPLTMEPVPAAARSWVVSEDGLEWTFTIRENARFQNGDPLRAEDFKAAWLSLLESERNAPYSSFFDIIEGAQDFRLDRGSREDVGILATGEKTLVLRLNTPAAFLPNMLCHHSFSPIHPSMLNEEDWSSVLPISNGPFFIEEKNDEGIVFAKNPRYWDAARVLLEKIIVRFVDDGEEAAAMWNSGEARWIQGNVSLNALRDRSGIEVNAMFATYYFFVRSARKPWDDFRLRRALSLVLPWEEIRGGHILPARTLIFPLPGYPDVAGLENTDTVEAKRLFSEAGFAEGAGLPELVIRIPPSFEAERIANIMADAWEAELGVVANIDIVPFDDYLASLSEDDYDVSSITWIGDFVDPYTFLKLWQKDSNLNDARHSDDDFEALINRSMQEEGATRLKTLAEAEELLLSRGNVLPISYTPALNIIDLNEISGWFPNVLDIHPFKYFSFRELRPLPGVVLHTPAR
jgi:peptide/nickel transport system substrate-binding protein/oligopeptide transport system substrate-binding protein